MPGWFVRRQMAKFAHRDRVLQLFRTADGKHQLTLMHPACAAQFKGGQVLLVNLEQRQIRLFVNANELCGQYALLAHRFKLREIERRHGQHHADAMRSLDDMRVGHNIAVRVHNHSRADEDERLL
jgi:hypothetical protein